MGFREWNERRKERTAQARAQWDAYFQQQERTQNIYRRLCASRLQREREGFYVNHDGNVRGALRDAAKREDTSFHSQLEKFVLETDIDQIVEARRRDEILDVLLYSYETDIYVAKLNEPSGPLGIFGIRTAV
jgi:hypothetical protein